MTTQHYFVLVGDNGTTFWYNDREHTILHRLGGPAFTCSGMSSWYQNGRLHRADGPAVEWADGTKNWYLDGIKVTQAQHKKLTAAPVEEMTMAQLEAALGKKIKIIK